MAQVSLRDLVQKYTRGEIGKDEYRKTRTDLIKDVLAREHTLRTNTFPPLIKPGDEGTLDITERSQKKDGGKSQAATTAGENAATSGSRPLNPLYIATALILVIITVIAVILLLPEHAPEQQATVQEPPKLQTPARVSTRAKTLIQEFLQNNKWDNDSLDTFLRAWTALSETDQKSIKGSMVLNRLTNAIYNRLLEERAIIGLDTTASETSADINKQDRLVFFARQLGINDDRIRIQTPTNPAPQPTEAQAETAPVAFRSPQA